MISPVHMFKAASGVVCGAALATAAAASTAPEVYVCAITKSGGFFADEIVFALQPDEMTGMVVDPLLLYYNDGRGREAVITERTDRKTVFRWELPMTSMSGQNAVMRFRGVLQRPSLRFLVSAQPSGFQTIFTGRGRCQPAEVEIEGL